MPKTFIKARQLFAAQKEFTDFEEYLGSRLAALEAGISEKILAGKATTAAGGMVWGKTINNVGYLFIPGMSGFSESEDDTEQVEILHQDLNVILSSLSDTRALIVDVSTNGGGMDLFSIAIASHFADARRLAFSKGPRNVPRIRHSVFVEPYDGTDAATYTKPIYLVASDITVSAAEIFVLAMKDMPHVKTVGSATRGALSDILSKTLPNGWDFGLSNEIYLDAQGICYEVKGIPPRVPMKILDAEEADTGHAAAIMKIAESANDR